MLDQIQEIPTLPQVTVELIRLAFQDEPDIKRVADTIEKDATLTAKLIRTVNTASFGMKVEVTNIQQAISILGLDSLKATIISIALGEFFLNNPFGETLDVKRYCSHSQATALIVLEAAWFLEVEKDNHLYLVGLLHDLGRLALDTIPGHSYQEVLDLYRAGQTLDQAEEAVYGCTSGKLWVKLARTWGFPDELVALYQGSVKGPRVMTTQALIEAASDLADRLGYYLIQPNQESTTPQDNVLVELSEDALLSIGEKVKQELESTRQVLDLPPPDQDEIQRVVLKTTHQLARTNAELAFRVEVLEELTSVFTGIIKSLEGESLTLSVLETLMEGFKAEGVFMLNRSGSSRLIGYAARMTQNEEPDIRKVRMEKDQISDSMKQCIKGQVPLKIEQPFREEGLADFLGDLSIGWLAPVYVKGRFVSLIGLGAHGQKNFKFTNRDFGKVLQILSQEVGLSVENCRLYSQMRTEAVTDPLTKLYNRRMIMKTLDVEFRRFQSEGIPLAVAIFDMDHFKSLNDTCGHQTGDAFLVKVAQVFKQGIRISDSVGRYGGDEFIAVFPDTPVHDAAAQLEKLQGDLRQACAEFDSPEMLRKLSVSVGVAGAESATTDAETFLRQADEALYQAKEQGRNCLRIYDGVGAGQNT